MKFSAAGVAVRGSGFGFTETTVTGALAGARFGAETPRLAQAIDGHADGDLATAVSHAAQLARPGDVVLLSPACASYDQFDNFEQRGDAFRAAVVELGS